MSLFHSRLIRSLCFVCLLAATAFLNQTANSFAQEVAPAPALEKETRAEPKVQAASSSAQTKEARNLASCEVETANFADITDRVKSEIALHGASNVLLVVDIDNTTLAMDQPLGSDQWYNWQYDFIFRKVDSRMRVARDLDELLKIQGVLFALGTMHPPEKELPALIEEIQQAGCCTIALTSRGPEFRDSTERELKRNDYDFSQSALPIMEPARGRFLPYDQQRPNIHGLGKDELASLRPARPVSYSGGIFMTAGQHKGYMLRTLLARSERTFRAIVFADDHDKHTTRMTAAFKDSGITTACFHYTREKPQVDAFDQSNKEPIATKWNELKQAVKKAFANSTE